MKKYECNKPVTFSLIIPCFNEELNVPIFYNKAKAVLKDLQLQAYEFLFVDDGSLDETLHEIALISEQDENVRYLSFSRNFGKEAAILAGMTYARYDYVAIMDVDMQDPPELLSDMFDILGGNEGYECVATRRTTRTGEPAVRSFCARMFYKLINSISDVQIVSGARDYRLMTRRMVDSILLLKESNRFSKGLFAWAGYRTKYLEYENIERSKGQTKWSFWKLLKYSFDGITAFSVAPLQIASFSGILVCLASFIAILFLIIQKLTVGIAVQGYALMMCAIFFLGGMQLLSIGILGQYIGKVFIECKHRPDYVILDTNISVEQNSLPIE